MENAIAIMEVLSSLVGVIPVVWQWVMGKELPEVLDLEEFDKPGLVIDCEHKNRLTINC